MPQKPLFQPPAKVDGPRRELPREAPNRPIGQDWFSDAMDAILSGVGVQDGLSPDASMASSLGVLLGLPLAGGVKAVRGAAAKGAKALGSFSDDAARGAKVPIGSFADAPPSAQTPPVRVQSAPDVEDYRGYHRPPDPEHGAPASDLTGNGTIYPDDVYSPMGQQYYGTGRDDIDAQTFAMLRYLRGKPDEVVTIYRAVPKDASATDIFPGDWVSVNRNYAREHGESALRGNYKIISKRVRARDIHTDGNSIHEWGYAPAKTPKGSKAKAAVLPLGMAITGGQMLQPETGRGPLNMQPFNLGPQQGDVYSRTMQSLGAQSPMASALQVLSQRGRVGGKK